MYLINKLRDMNKDDVNSQTNVVKSVEGKDNLFFATNNEVDKTKWVMDSTASKHICRDREMFNTLKIYGEFSHFKLQNGGKMKVKGIGSVRMKLHDGVIQTFSNVRFVPSVVVSMISMGEGERRRKNEAEALPNSSRDRFLHCSSCCFAHLSSHSSTISDLIFSCKANFNRSFVP